MGGPAARDETGRAAWIPPRFERVFPSLRPSLPADKAAALEFGVNKKGKDTQARGFGLSKAVAGGGGPLSPSLDCCNVTNESGVPTTTSTCASLLYCLYWLKSWILVMVKRLDLLWHFRKKVPWFSQRGNLFVFVCFAVFSCQYYIILL